MTYERPEIFRIGRLEDHTFGGNKQTDQDSCDGYSRDHGESSVKASLRKARQLAARS